MIEAHVNEEIREAGSKSQQQRETLSAPVRQCRPLIDSAAFVQQQINSAKREFGPVRVLRLQSDEGFVLRKFSNAARIQLRVHSKQQELKQYPRPYPLPSV